MLSDKPLYKRSPEKSDPALWSPKDVIALIVNGPDGYVSRRGRAPPATLENGPIMEDILEELEEMFRENANRQDIFSGVYDVIEYSMGFVGEDRQLSVLNCGIDWLVVNGKRFNIPFHLGCTVNGIPVLHYTDSYTRYKERHELIPDLKHELDDEMSLHGFDIAALIAQAAMQKKFLTKSYRTYKTHVMYPTSDYKKFVLLTGRVPSITIDAIMEGHAKLEPIEFYREVIDVPFDPKCDWNKIDFFHVIAGLIDESAALSTQDRQKP